LNSGGPGLKKINAPTIPERQVVLLWEGGDEIETFGRVAVLLASALIWRS
jgi:hypothetical protein